MMNAPDWGYMAQLSTTTPRVSWSTFVTQLQWKQGEHVALIGPTGQGKTTLLLALLPLQPYVVVFATKPQDSTMEQLIDGGYQRMDKWRRLSPHDTPRRVLWPPARSVNSAALQQEVFTDAMEHIFVEGGWTVAIDELWYVVNRLRLGEYVKQYLLQARSLFISLVVATQRPAWVPLEVYDQSTHLFFWRSTDKRSLRRLSELNTISADLVERVVSTLAQHEVLYVNSRTGGMMRTQAPRPPDS